MRSIFALRTVGNDELEELVVRVVPGGGGGTQVYQMANQVNESRWTTQKEN